jgi:exoribonuclease R
VNQRKYEQCFIDNPDGAEQSDLLILGTKDRNRAFHGDLVVVRLKPKTSWFIPETIVRNYKLKYILFAIID